MNKYTYPKPASSVLISIDVQNDSTIVGTPAKIRGFLFLDRPKRGCQHDSPFDKPQLGLLESIHGKK